MSSSDEYLAKLGLDFGDAEKAFQSVISLSARVAQDFPETEKAMGRVERMLTKMSSSSRDAATGVGSVGKRAREGAGEWDAYRQKLEAANAAYREFKRGEAMGTKGLVNPLAAMGDSGRQQLLNINAAENASAIQGIKELGTVAGNAADNELPRLRYALYDLSNASGVAGLALVAGGAAVAAVSIQYQRLFADVERTSTLLNTGPEGDAYFDGLKNSLLDLTGELPVAFSEISKIATLGNQLDIKPDALVAYTETVAKFSAVTGVAVEETATQLARVGQLSGQGDYVKLGDQVAYLGVNAVATEGQILGVAEEISVSARAAGFASEQTIALATAMASLGIAPEQARGSILRTFGEITTAVDGGGAALDAFADVAGVSAGVFAQKWKSAPQAAFTDLLYGLDAIEKQGGNVDGTLKSLGITATRDSQSIQLLAQNVQTLRSSQNDLDNAGGFLDESAAVIVETTAAKIEILQNNVMRLLDTMGAGAVGPIASLVDGLNGIVGVANDILSNPIYSWMLAIGVGAGVVVGAILLAVSVFLRFTATILGVRTAQIELGANSNLLRFTIEQLSLAMTKNGASATAMATAQRGAGAAGVQAAAGQTALNSSQTAGAAAGGKLTKVLGAAGLVGTILTLVPLVYSGVDALFAFGQEMTGATTSAQGLIDKVTELQGKQQSLKGPNGALPSALTSTQSPGTRLPAADLFANQRDQGAAIPGGKNPDGSQALEASMKATTITATNYKNALKELDAALAQMISDGNTQGAAALADAYKDSIQGTKLETDSMTKLLPQYSGALDNSAGSAAAAGDAAAQMAAGLGEAEFKISDLIDATYGAYNANYDLAQSTGALGEAFVNEGAQAAFSGQALQQVIADIYAASSSGPDAAAKMQGLFNALVQGGYASAQQLAGLASIISQLTGGKGVVKAATFDMGNFTKGVKKATAAVGGGGGGGGKKGGGGGGLTQAVRTLVDYASDLSGVFKRAFDIRFSGDQGADKITTGWNAARKSFEGAEDAVGDLQQAMRGVNDQINGYQADMATLTSDKSIREYWLGIADAYGDTLRAGQLRAEIGEIDADLAEKTGDVSAAQAENVQNSEDLKVAQDATSRALTGNTEAAIANRATLLGLVGTYQEQITALAASGLSTQELNRRTAELKEEFIRQATQLGYNRQEVLKYAASFDDMTAAINRVPKNITVDANVEPAIQALKEFEAKADQAGRNAASSIASGGSGGGGYSVPDIAVDPVIIPVRYKTPSYAELMRMQQTIREQTGDPNFRVATGAGGGGGQVFGYSKGGWTGDGNASDVAGVVHKKEFVLNQRGAQAFPREMLEAANRGKSMTPSAPRAAKSSASATQVVELSPYDRQLLAAAGNVSVEISRSAIADAAGAAGVNASNRGDG